MNHDANERGQVCPKATKKHRAELGSCAALAARRCSLTMPVSAAAMSAMSTWARDRVPMVRLITVPDDGSGRAPSVELRRLVVVVVPAAAVSVVPTVAVPIRSAAIEVDGLGSRDVTVQGG